jgi:hypothetical protein
MNLFNDFLEKQPNGTFVTENRSKPSTKNNKMLTSQPMYKQLNTSVGSFLVTVIFTAYAFSTDLSKFIYVTHSNLSHQQTNNSTTKDVDPWNKYLTNLQEKEYLTIEHINNAKYVIDKIGIQPHKADVTSSNVLLLVWETENHYLDIEIHEDRSLEWFYSNKTTKKIAGNEAISVKHLLESIKPYLSHVS